MLYNNLSGYFKNKYGKKVRKICIDGGFTCPNRDGKCGVGGCIFCGERGAGDHIKANCLSISEQVISALSTAPRDQMQVAYFQNFTNTYSDVKDLKEKYDSALIDERIVALAVGTRPDCITEDIAKLLHSYTEKYDVWVELGLQTADDNTAKFINRGYDSSVFAEAVKILNKWGLPVVVHIIIGLPGETIENVKKTITYINKFSLWGIKIHSIYVMKGTILEKLYLDGKYAPLSMEEYIESAIHTITHISPQLVIHRLTGDCPRNLLIAPEWNTRKNEILNIITSTLQRNGWYQGCFYDQLNEESK